MAEYTYKDVIIDPDDPRVEIGKEYYFGCLPRDVLKKANTNSSLIGELKEIRKEDNFPFVFMGFTDGRSCIIRKKEPEYVPFDLKDREQISSLYYCWLVDKDHGDYYCVTAIYPHDNIVHIDDYGDISPEDLLERFTFMWNGTPCGKPANDQQMASK